MFYIFRRVNGVLLRRECYNPIVTLPIRKCYSESEILNCFAILGLSPDSDQEAVRQAFICLVKKYHPDSGSADANAEKFQEIDEAYRKLQEKFADDRWNVNKCAGEFGLYYEEKRDPEVEDHDIEHTAPQHRQYLSYGGVGSGTPSQRQRIYQCYRAAKAVENVNIYRHSKLQETLSKTEIMKRETKKKAKDIKTGFGMERLVEDLIQESIARGEFDNLSGSGKPLLNKSQHDNPYVDFITHKMNQVLLDNGFTPVWITLQKEVREGRNRLLEELSKERAKLGELPLDADDENIWKTVKKNLEPRVKHLNQKIDTYNLMVPILNKQILQFSLESESQRILKEVCGRKEGTIIKTDEKTGNKKRSSLLGMVTSLFH